MKKTLLFALALLAALTGKADNDMLYGLYQGNGTLKNIGTEKAETYDVAIHLTEDYLVGMEVRGVNVPVNTSAMNATDYQAWIATDLKVESGKNVSDVASVSFTPDGKWAEVNFATPYVITEGGIYVGYTFTVSSVDVNAASDQNRTPLTVIAAKDGQEGYIHTSRTYRKWTTLGTTTLGNYVPAVVVRLSGDLVKASAATFLAPSELSTYAFVGKQTSINLTLVNHGVDDIKNIDYEMDIDGDVTPVHKTVSLSGKYYGRSTSMKVNIPAMSTKGTRHVTFRITQVNGQTNEDAQPAATLSLPVLDGTPKRKPIMEEYTGAWCGNCPRGMAAMEALSEQLGDDFVGVAWHNGDAMTITNNYPNPVQAFPHGFLDRIVELEDPFYGSTNSSLGVKTDWQKRVGAIIAPATLELQAEWANDESTAITVTSQTTFVRDFTDSPFRMAYILLADSLTGWGRGWSQSNYLAGDNSAKNDPYLSRFYNLPGTITDMAYNDVAIQVSSPGATAIAESLPAMVEEYQPYVHRYTFDISQNELVQDKTRLRVVAVLVNTLTGEVVNAEKTNVPLPVGVRGVRTDEQPQSIDYTDLAGRRIQRPGHGLYVRTVTHADGTRHSSVVSR